jgi:hypothetical protein
MQPCLSPVTQLAICRRRLPRSLCCDQTHDDVGPMAMVEFCREHDGRPDLRRLGARKCAYHDIAGLQRPSRSCCSNRSRDAVVASLRSSSDHESDQSIGRVLPRSASCCAQSSTFLASSGGSIRTTLMSDCSLVLRVMHLLFYAFCVRRHEQHRLQAEACSTTSVLNGVPHSPAGHPMEMKTAGRASSTGREWGV